MAQLSSFNHFTFEPIDFHQFYEAFDLKYRFLPNTYAQEIFDAWLFKFLKRVDMFYYAQYIRHENLLMREFRKEHNLPEDSNPSEWALDDVWQEKCNNTGLHEHHEDFQYRRESINETRKELQKRIGHKLFADKLDSVISNPLPMKAINELWFDTTICNPESLVNDLHQLSYERYLKSPHWARVKSAMLLIHKAVCQEEFHFTVGESWYFGDWESDIDVHHLNYKNLGNERYKDLILLCRKHHTMWHENMKTIGSPGINIVDDII